MKKEEYLMKVWNNLISYYEDFEIDMDQEEKLRFAQGYLFGLQMCGDLMHKDYIQLMNEITNLIVKGEC